VFNLRFCVLIVPTLGDGVDVVSRLGVPDQGPLASFVFGARSFECLLGFLCGRQKPLELFLIGAGSRRRTMASRLSST
jgi:hypothetical protein